MLSMNSPEMKRAASAFDDLLVTALFRKWAKIAASEVDPIRDTRLLDVACGTGVLARELAGVVGDTGKVIGIDANAAMLDVAAQIAPDIEWMLADAAALPFEDGSFDHVFCQFGLMLFDEPESALSEMWRVLAPGGATTVLVFDHLDRNPVYERIASTYEDWIGPVLSQSLRSAFSLGSKYDIADLFERVGLTTPRVETQTVTAEFPSVDALVMSDVKGWFPFSGVILRQEVIDAIVADMKRVLAPYIAADGSISFPVVAHLVTADRSGRTPRHAPRPVSSTVPDDQLDQLARMAVPRGPLN